MAGPREAPTLLPRLLAGVVCLVVTATVVALGLAVHEPHHQPQRSPAPVSASDGADEREAYRVLREWDHARARSWASVDLAALRRLYTPGSAAGRRDVAMLRRWRQRGLRVAEMRMQVAALEVAHRGPRRLVLVVTDRVAATATTSGVRQPLPTDGFDTRRITLHRLRGTWRVASVLPVGEG